MSAANDLTVEGKAQVAHAEDVNQLQQHYTTDHVDIVEEKINAVHAGQRVQLKSSLDKMSLSQSLSTFWRSILVCGFAGFAAVTDGYQNQMAASIIANKGFIKEFAKGASALDPPWVSSFGGIFSAGQVIGQFTIPFVSDFIGRKGAMYVFMVILTVSVIVESVANVWYVWTIAKLIGGIGIGAVQATLPVYINEHAPSQIRGFLIVAYSLWFSLGGLLASIALNVRSKSNPLDYKSLIYTQFGMIGLSILIFVFLPESPWWLASKGKFDKARAVLEKKFSGIPDYDIDGELAIIAATIEKQREWDREAAAEGTLAIFKGLNGKRFLIGSWPKVLQQFIGLSIFSSYSAYFFSLAGNKNPFNVTVILGCVSLLSVILDATLVDKIGRRRMTLIGFSGAAAGMLLISIVGCFDYANAKLGAVLVFGGVTANFFNTFQSSTSYAYLSEMPEQRFRAKATGWGLAYCNLYAIMFNFTVPLMLKKWVVKTAFLFIGLGIPGTILAFFIMPESMGRSPAEIHEMFVDRVPLRKWKGYKTHVEDDLDARLEI
ncbi:uncharacterized protein I303_103268 [Kwoniella dejecticola CBS 10117]|uniref:Major facilitator superfamily (MFS) profile domain-containing protein n=1 Tax=Kwoniella dejecticola CBS 10117 TaxID=1296121 RepID=A0A1A6A6A0_9TREE|nr:uncharacterized protein I303_03291 [Kwoniella dejecticola CBS 10117]OBR85580.1 hypothetical protein I303_03291 [Kwoniella dejecticola CBS 10117]